MTKGPFLRIFVKNTDRIIKDKRNADMPDTVEAYYTMDIAFPGSQTGLDIE